MKQCTKMVSSIVKYEVNLWFRPGFSSLCDEVKHSQNVRKLACSDVKKRKIICKLVLL